MEANGACGSQCGRDEYERESCPDDQIDLLKLTAI
jgi:hypothetical protein